MTVGSAQDFGRQLAIARAWLWVIVLCGAVGAVAGFWVAGRTPPTYASTTVLFIGPHLPLPSGTPIDAVLAGRALAPVYAELATTTPILERTIAATGVAIAPGDLRPLIQAVGRQESGVVSIRATFVSPGEAAAIASEIAAQLEAFAAESSLEAAALTVVTIEPATVSAAPTSPGPLVRTIVGLLIGVALAMAAAFLVENLRPASGVGFGPPVGPLSRS